MTLLLEGVFVPEFASHQKRRLTAELFVLGRKHLQSENLVRRAVLGSSQVSCGKHIAHAFCIA